MSEIAAGLGPSTDSGGGSSSGPLTPLAAQPNNPVFISSPEHHETALAVGKHQLQATQVPNWVIAFNVNKTNTIGWGVSTNLDASTWDVYTDSGTAFGDPCDGGTCMANGKGFGGTNGDPALATVTNPSANGSSPSSVVGTYVLYTQLANATNSVATDVMVALSQNGGQTFGNPALLTHGLAGDGGTGSLGFAVGSSHTDNPVIASHFSTPYLTYAAWNVLDSNFNSLGGFITQVSYDSSFNLRPLTPLPNAQIPAGAGPDGGANSGAIFHPAIAVGQALGCDNTQHEIVYVAWADNVAGAGGGGTGTSSVNWWLGAFDTEQGDASTQGWLNGGPWQIDSDSKWPNGVGSPLDGGILFSDNDVRPRLAVEPGGGDKLWMAINHSTPKYGAQTKVWQITLVCSNGVWAPGTGGPPPWTPPVKCWENQGNGPCNNSCNPPCNDPTGNSWTVNDQWGPAIAFVYNDISANRELVATWYDTRLDINNNLVTMFGGYQVATTITNSLTLFQVGVGASGQTVPWSHFVAPWSDYQALASEPLFYQFLGAWGGDARWAQTTPAFGRLS